MRISSIVGIVLILLGVAGLVWGGVSFTQEEEVADVGPLEVRTEETEEIPIPPLVGGVALRGGILLVIVGARKR